MQVACCGRDRPGGYRLPGGTDANGELFQLMFYTFIFYRISVILVGWFVLNMRVTEKPVNITGNVRY
jgi:hypothetical protein